MCATLIGSVLPGSSSSDVEPDVLALTTLTCGTSSVAARAVSAARELRLTLGKMPIVRRRTTTDASTTVRVLPFFPSVLVDASSCSTGELIGLSPRHVPLSYVYEAN